MSALDWTWEDGANLPPQDSKVTAVHACLTRLGQVLFFHCRSYPFWTRIYDPVSNTVFADNYVVPKWPVFYEAGENTPAYPIQPSKIFCSGHCFLPDGRLLVAGGELNNPYPDAYEPIAPDRGLRYSFIFDPAPVVDPGPPDPEKDYWKVTGDPETVFIMKEGRWYPTLTLLNDGTVLCMAGLTDSVVPNPFEPDEFTVLHNRIPEIYVSSGEDQGWFSNNATDAKLPVDIFYSYPDAYVVPVGDLEGKVFYASTQLVPDSSDPPSYSDGYSQIFDPFTTSAPYWEAITNRRTTPSEGSSGVLLPIRIGSSEKARVIITGGKWGSFLDRIDLINLDPQTGSPIWNSNVVTMETARADHNAVLLPDRTLLIIGGIDSAGPVLTSELLDTDTLEWIDPEVQVIPEMPVPRRYHSTAILLPDARILLGGGRVENGGDVENDTERRLSILKPAYLSDGDQPVITDYPEEITYEESFSITVDGAYALDSIALMKPGAVTHGSNMDQRYIELSFEEEIIPGPGPGTEYNVTAPENSFIAPPGYYMLFVLKDKSESISGESRIPSHAKFIRLS